MTSENSGILQANNLQSFLNILQQEGYTVIAPKREAQCITYGEINSIQELPQGWTDVQEKGSYRLKKREDNAYFGYNIGIKSFKDFLFLPRENVFKIDHQQPTQVLSIAKHPKYAFLGVRSCELTAIQIQDKVFMEGAYVDPNYTRRRELAFIIAFNCHTTASTCFCDSMNTGPAVKQGFDISLSEILTSDTHDFLLEAGSDKGLSILQKLHLQPVMPWHIIHKQKMLEQVRKSQWRKIDNENITQHLYAAHDHPHWDKVAERCINCTNCTLVCPTCFCSKNEETTPIDEKATIRAKVWDSCFSQEFSYVHDSFVRDSAKSRYRQWLTHKLGSWHDQFGSSGCVGCGRCITFCPVGIDITEEFAAIREDHAKNI